MCTRANGHGRIFAPAIQQMASPDVTVNSEKIDSNILIVTLNSSKITPAQFYDMMLKVFKCCDVHLYVKTKQKKLRI